MAYVCKSITTDHKDLIHDVSYDYYGKRMATCSSDQVVKIWDLDGNGEWVCTSTLKGHNGSVWKVTWAHPEFGQIIATCSFDRTAAVWEESVSDSGHGIQNTWIKRASLVDSRSSVTDVKFAPAPKIQGLQLATCSADGVVKIYEATDVMSLCHWTLIHDIPTKLASCSCLSWNPSLSRMHPPLIAVGSDDPNTASGGKVAIYEFSENARKWNRLETLVTVTDAVHDLAFAPNLGRSYHLLAVATKDLKIISLKPTRQQQTPGSLTSFELRQVKQFDDHGSTVWRVCWNMLGTILASSADDGNVKLWKANYLDIWRCISTVRGEEVNMNGPDNCVAVGSSTSGNSHTTKYFKLAPTAHPNHVPWH